MTKESLAGFDNIFMLSLAIAVWIPCFIQIYFGLSSLYYITQTFLFGTAYLLLTRMVVTLCFMWIAAGYKQKLKESDDANA